MCVGVGVCVGVCVHACVCACVWSTGATTAYLFELTVCFDTSFSSAAEKKTNKYFELVEAIGSTTAYRCYLYRLQVGS